MLVRVLVRVVFVVHSFVVSTAGFTGADLAAVRRRRRRRRRRHQRVELVQKERRRRRRARLSVRQHVF